MLFLGCSLTLPWSEYLLTFGIAHCQEDTFTPRCLVSGANRLLLVRGLVTVVHLRHASTKKPVAYACWAWTETSECRTRPALGRKMISWPI